MIDLKPFCSKEETRYYLMTPWSRGNFTYATNGHIAVRIDRVASIEENDICPDVEKILPDYAAFQFLPVGEVAFPPQEMTKCDVCEGRGTEHECGDCTHACDECEGKGAIEVPVSCDFRKGIFSLHYLRILKTLPGVAAPAEYTGKNIPMPFIFDGGVGVIMPMKWHVTKRFDASAA